MKTHQNRVTVRALCDFTARAGDLDLRFTPSPSALEGIAGHRLVQTRRASTYETEIPLSAYHEDLLIRGRADGYDPDIGQLEEIKTYRGSLEGIKQAQRALHWAQAKIYGYLLCKARDLAELRVALVYFNLATSEETVLSESFDARALEEFFVQHCTRYLAWAQSERAHRTARDHALRALQFPLGSFRQGQRALAEDVYRSTRVADPGQCLLAQAPTGIGKTMGTLFPMLKACAMQGIDKVFFLTAKGTGHEPALQALQQVQAHMDGAEISLEVQAAERKTLRVLALQGRDKTCVHPDKACHGESCPLARGFYDRLPAARLHAVQHPGSWDSAAIHSLALDHDVCPYYLSQELARWADVIVADYHYYYGGSALLYALAQEREWKTGVLVDEAHNLIERARTMYSVELSSDALADARRVASGSVRQSLDRLQRHWRQVYKDQAASYQAHDQLPAAFLRALQRSTAEISTYFAGRPLPPADPVLVFYWSALQFLVLAEEFGPHALFDVQVLSSHSSSKIPASGTSRPSRVSRLGIRNVVPAPHLMGRHAAAHATVLFSGTLNPPDYYRDLLGLLPHAKAIEVDAPFLPQQLEVRTVAHISTRYRDREASLQPMARLIAEQFSKRPGNYLLFVSSFDYLRQAGEFLRRHYPDLPLWVQTRSMNPTARQAFLDRFEVHGKGIGLAVLGGAFSEGVDLPGQRLIGVFVATLGLPQVNPLNEQIMRTMHAYFGARRAYAYTYLYPGLRKVVQAAGRVIRTEHDQGTVHLIDDRYNRPEVRALLPRWWQVQG